MGYYIYKYVKDNRIIYVGQTTDLNKRIRDHTRDKLASFTGQIYYFECPNKTAMDSWEYCLINKYHPSENIALKDTNINIEIKEPEWKLYQTREVKDIRVIKPKNKKLRELIEIEFRCSRCRISFTTKRWFKTPKGYSAFCPHCPYSVWISKEQVRRQIKYKNMWAKK